MQLSAIYKKVFYFKGDSMGKKSLIKSTAKKKVTQTKKTAAKKPDPNTKPSVKTKKTAPKAKSDAKTKQTDTKPPAKKVTVTPKKLTMKELLFKKFEPTALQKKLSAADVDLVTGNFTAPPFVFSDNDKNNQKIKKLLFNTYNMEILKAAAEKAAAEKAAAEKAAAEKAAAEKAAAEKAAAEKAAAEKAAAEKAAAEKAAAEKAAAEKAAAEKAAAEKAAAEKAAAEKAAAEKAAAEKAAAEKAAAEKAAAEKAAAEKTAAEKAAAEKAAAEKAAAEQAAAEKAAAEKAAAEKADPMDKTIKFAAIAFGLIFIVLVLASISNSYKYTLQPADGAIEIWQGDFAPMGQKLMLSIPGGEMPQPTKPEYRKKEVFPLAFNYYISQADALAEVPGMPDFEGIKTYLNKALDYATDRAEMNSANIRVNTIELLVLLYKAQAAAGQATLAGLESAVDYLEEATMLDIDAAQLALVEEKIKAVTGMKAELAALQAAEEAAAAEKAAAAEEETAAAEKEEANQAAAIAETQLADKKNTVVAETPQTAAEKIAHTE